MAADDALYFALTLIWFVRGRKHDAHQKPDKHAWTKTNTLFLVLAVLLVPLTYVFFNTGELHGPTNQVAVMLTFVQYILINLSLVPWKPQRR